MLQSCWAVRWKLTKDLRGNSRGLSEDVVISGLSSGWCRLVLPSGWCRASLFILRSWVGDAQILSMTFVVIKSSGTAGDSSHRFTHCSQNLISLSSFVSVVIHIRINKLWLNKQTVWRWMCFDYQIPMCVCVYSQLVQFSQMQLWFSSLKCTLKTILTTFSLKTGNWMICNLIFTWMIPVTL